jgi:transketolase C-terminal domain/subunit
MRDRFGESGTPAELLDHFGLTGVKMVDEIKRFCEAMPRYHQ